MVIEISECRLSDFSDVMALLRQLWPERKPDIEKMLRAYKKAIKSKNQIYLKAVHEGKCIGFCSLSILNTLYGNGESMHIDELVIDENHRSKGIGKRILGHVRELARQKSCSLIELDTALHRLDAHRFYENMGYSKMGYVFSLKLD